MNSRDANFSQAPLDSPVRGLAIASGDSEELTKLRRDNFNLRLLCHNYKQIYENGHLGDSAMRITDLECENSRLSEQLREKAYLLNCASKMLESLKVENENLRARDGGKIPEIPTSEIDAGDGIDIDSNFDESVIANLMVNGTSDTNTTTSTEANNTTFDVLNPSGPGRTSSNTQIVNTSGLERQNQQVLDRVTLAMNQMQDTIDRWSVKDTTEFLTVLAVSDDDDKAKQEQLEIGAFSSNLSTDAFLGREGDCVSGEASLTVDKDKIHCEEVGDDEVTEITSEICDTLADVSCSQAEFTEIAEVDDVQSGLGSDALSKDGEGVVPINAVDAVNGLLIRFVKVMARVQMLTITLTDRAAGANNSGALSTTDREVISGDLLAWSEKAQDWFTQFIGALRKASSLPMVVSNLEVLECEFTEKLSLLEKLRKETVNQEAKSRIGTQLGEYMPLQEHNAIVANYESKCNTLIAANEELQKAYARLAEELKCTRRKHSESISSLQSTTVSKKDYDDLLGRLAQTQSIVSEYEKRFEQFQAYEEKITEIEVKYSALVKQAKYKRALAEEHCKRLASREQKLSEELEVKQMKVVSLEKDLKAALLTAAEAQAEVENLKNLVATEREEKDRLSEMRSTFELAENAREYAELKTVASELKSRLLKRVELLENSLREARRLRGMVCDNEECAEGFAKELEPQCRH